MHLYTQKFTRIWKVYLNHSKWTLSLDSFIWLSLVQPDTRLSPPLRRQSSFSSDAYEILLQHDWLFIFSRHNRFAETHSHLQLSYHITDRLLAAVNEYIVKTRGFQNWVPFNSCLFCICKICIPFQTNSPPPFF